LSPGLRVHTSTEFFGDLVSASLPLPPFLPLQISLLALLHPITYLIHFTLSQDHFLRLYIPFPPPTQLPPTNSSSQQPTTNNQQPTTNNQQPTTNNQQPTTNNQQPTTNDLARLEACLLSACFRKTVGKAITDSRQAPHGVYWQGIETSSRKPSRFLAFRFLSYLRRRLATGNPSVTFHFSLPAFSFRISHSA
jgi:hypothetical protein